MRYIERKKEQSWLVHVPKTESGLASRMGHLEGLDGILPHHTMEFLPYVVTRGEFLESSPAIRSTMARVRLQAWVSISSTG